jgi:hypothetical protein
MAIALYGQNKQGTEINDLIDDVRVYKFEHAPIVSDATRLGGAAKLLDGGTEEQVSLQFPDGLNLNCAYMGACTVDGPTGTSLGMTWEQGDSNNLGYQFVMCHASFKGIDGVDTFTIGSTPAFYMKHKFKIGTVGSLDYCMAGFRLKSQTHIADPKATYTDYACLDVDNGDIKVETALNNSTATPTDTTDDWADGEVHTIEVYVSAAGVATFKIDGVAPTVNTHTFTFDDGDAVTPFFVAMKDTGAGADVVHIELEVGLQ